MDERLKGIVDGLENMKIGLDETFSFHCTMCGKCCIDRKDVLLTPRDIYNMSKELKIIPEDLYNQFCEGFIGSDTRFPIVRLKSRETDRHCPMLKNKRCMAHNAKPVICAMFPIGRFLVSSDGVNDNINGMGKNQIQYVFNDLGCGDKSETHTVQGYLESAGVPVPDEFFIQWKQAVLDVGSILGKMEKIYSKETMMKVWTTAMVEIYLHYDTGMDFMSQFRDNVKNQTMFLFETPM